MTLILSKSDVEGLLTMSEVIAAVEACHADIARGDAVQPAPTGLSLAPASAAFVAMAALGQRQGLAATKLLADVPANATAGLPVQRSVVVLVSQETGACEAVIHGQVPTRMRTAAASAVASRYLAGPDSRSLGLVGAGALALEHVGAMRLVRPIDRVAVWSRTPATLDRFVEQARSAYPEVAVQPVATPRDAVLAADIVCTLTPSREPIVHGAWFQPGQHINAVGAPPRADHREIDSEGMRRAHVVVDSRSAALHDSGDLLLAMAEGAIDADARLAELGEVIVGSAPGRTQAGDITLYNSIGIAMQDLAIGSLLLARAREAGAGREIDLAR